MRSIVRSLLALLLSLPAFALAATGLSFVSTPGDYIGGGARASYTPPTATVTATGTAGSVRVVVTTTTDWWYFDIAAPQGEALVPGDYPAAARYPFQSPLGPGLSLVGNGRGCNTLLGWFRVREYVRDASGAVQRLAVDFVQNCEVSMPPLYGAVRVNSRLPLVVPSLAAVAGPDQGLDAGAAGRLDGSQSFTRRRGGLAYAWTQLEGPATPLDDPAAVQPRFTAPDVGPEGATLRYRLTVTEAGGRSASDEVLVLVLGAGAERTRLSFRGDPGDYITGGASYRYDASNAALNFSRNFDNGVSVSVNGATWWYLDFAAPGDVPLVPGTYTGAVRFPFQAPDQPGLSLSGDGRGCNTLTGQFTVHQAEYDGAGTPTRLDISFEQHCEGAVPGAYGELLLNAVPREVLAQRLRAARARR